MKADEFRNKRHDILMKYADAREMAWGNNLAFSADPFLQDLATLDAEYARAKQPPPVYAMVVRLEQLARTLLSVSDTPHAQAGILDTVMAECVKYRATLQLDTITAELTAIDVQDFISAEDA